MAKKPPVAKTNSRERARSRKQGNIRSLGRPWWLILTGTLLTAIVFAALILAGLATAYIALKIARPELIDHIPTHGVDLNDNLTVGVTFFWLELFGIAALIKAYDWAIGRVETRKRFFDLYAWVKQVIEEIWEARYRFAVDLDASKGADGAYDADYWGLNRALGNIRESFLNKVLCDVRISDHGRLVADQVLLALSNSLRDTYEVAEQAQAATRAARDRIAAAAPAAPAEGESAGAPPPPATLTPEEQARLEQLLERMFEMADPELRGLGRLQRSLEAAARTLRFRQIEEADREARGA